MVLIAEKNSLRDLYTAAPNPETQRLYARFTGADILMATLDGLQVKRYMENRPLPGFRDDLGTLLALLSNHHKAVNLILTKWDILEDQTGSKLGAKSLSAIQHDSALA